MRHLKHINKLILGKSSEGIQILVRLEDREAKSIGSCFFFVRGYLLFFELFGSVVTTSNY